VESVRGAGGYYRLKPGFRLPPLMFTDEEAFALTLGLKALRHLGLAAFAPAGEGAAAKLGRVLPEPLRESVQTIEDVVALEPGPWVISTSAESLIRIASAIRMRRRVAFDYQSHAGETSHREIEPYGVVHMDGRWYMAGRCLLREDLRTFRLDRVSKLELRHEMFERPSRFDIKAHMQESMPFVQSAFRVEVWLDLPLQQAHAQFPLHRVMMQEENGGTALRCGRENLEAFAAMLLSVGCGVVVRKPQELKDAFALLAERAARVAGAIQNDVSAQRGICAETVV
jgi:predicted DNA-binding transcriptional regulator YafY